MQGYVPQAQYDDLLARYQQLGFRLQQLERMVFGAKSERYVPERSPGQLSLFGQGATPDAAPVTVPAHERKGVKRTERPVRLQLPGHLEREETVIEPDVDTTNMVRIGEERTEMLAYTPPKLTVKVIVRPKYAPQKTRENPADPVTIHIAPLPSRFIDKCIAHESLLTSILTDKYVDHPPLYRIAARFERQGVTVPRSTMGGWIAQSADQIVVVYNKLMALVLGSNYLQVDETRMEVLANGPPKRRKGGKPKKRKTHRGFMWGYLGVHEKLVFFDYDPTRQATNPAERLKGFTGTLQTDAYDVYDQVRKAYPELTHYHCLNHARRGFEKALAGDARRAGHALEEFQLLYAIERRAREENWDTQKIKRIRQEEARPILERLFGWMETELPGLRPKGPMAQAMGYMLKRKERMSHYLTDGSLLIDTNPVENAFRPIAVGRRNYLFAGSHEGAQRAAIFYSLFACCKLHEVDPAEWLADVMKRLPEHPVNQVEKLLPHLWKKEKETARAVEQMVAT